MTNALDLANKRGSMPDLSCHSYITHSSSHGRTLTESNNDGDEIKRPHKKQSNVRTMARINLYSRIKVRITFPMWLLMKINLFVHLF